MSELRAAKRCMLSLDNVCYLMGTIIVKLITIIVKILMDPYKRVATYYICYFLYILLTRHYHDLFPSFLFNYLAAFDFATENTLYCSGNNNFYDPVRDIYNNKNNFYDPARDTYVPKPYEPGNPSTIGTNPPTDTTRLADFLE